MKEAVYHVAHGNFAQPIAQDTLRITLRAGKGNLKEVRILYQDRYEGQGQFVAPMEVVAEDELFSFFQGDIQLATRRFAYAFLLDDGCRQLFYTEKGFFADLMPGTLFQYPYIAPGDLWEPPSWAQGAVIYQIFPDRFKNGDPSNDPPNVEPWGRLPISTSQKGGDLQGVIEQLPYLADLGIDVIYLTPIFKAPSNHRYDTVDYYKIDPHFGTEETVRELIRKCHGFGIKVIFDAVFNHCGYGFFAFQDVLEKGGKSQYAHWFNIESFPVKTDPPNYETFANQVRNMPKLMTHESDVKDYFLEVAAHWVREFKIDGWRLDVANEVDHRFWRKFREVVKKENPEALIVGEVWHGASAWLQGDQFDCVMNYPFQSACLDFFAKQRIRAGSFANRLAKVRMNYSHQVNLSMFNLLGSHDTERFLTSCQGDLRRFLLAVTFQLTFEGAPMVYYGDEIGMVGQNDPDCRRGMIWDQQLQNQELLFWYKQLIALRKQYTTLRVGETRIVWADSATNIVGFVRYCDQQQILVVLNNSSARQELSLKDINWPRAIPREVGDLLGEGKLKMSQVIEVEPYGVRILG